MAQLRNLGEGGGGYAMVCLVDDLDQAMALPELDGTLVTELMEDLPPSDLVHDGDRLSHVIRSFEAEIVTDDGEAAEAMVADDGGASRVPGYDGGRFQDMLLELDEYEGGSSFTHWPEVPLVVEAQEVDGWYVYMDNGHEGTTAVHEALLDHQYCYAESFAEQVYIPLWE